MILVSSSSIESGYTTRRIIRTAVEDLAALGTKAGTLIDMFVDPIVSEAVGPTYG